MTPHHQASSGIMAQFLKYYHAGLIGRYTGSRFAINDTLNVTPQAKPYYVMDVKLSYDRDPLEIYANINNILGEQYSSYVVKAAGSTVKDEFPAPETNFTVGANLKF